MCKVLTYLPSQIHHCTTQLRKVCMEEGMLRCCSVCGPVYRAFGWQFDGTYGTHQAGSDKNTCYLSGILWVTYRVPLTLTNNRGFTLISSMVIACGFRLLELLINILKSAPSLRPSKISWLRRDGWMQGKIETSCYGRKTGFVQGILTSTIEATLLGNRGLDTEYMYVTVE